MKLIVGLGNPGDRFDGTRHNAGFETIDILADELNVKLNNAKFHAQFGYTTYNGDKLYLMKPMTYMNESGIAIREFMAYYKLDIKDLIVIVDDIDINFATLRIKKSGSAGTHNGLKSIVYQLNNDKFTRVKIGVGNKPEHFDLADFVLSRYSKEEKVDIEKTYKNAAKACLCILDKGEDYAMNMYNGK
ncbi:aminoacyl-tRNA hydrolase [Fenollaria massiliensis]|uniref:Peptidyl-tRNA hydrolase n=1 Tax=Fenollaria massiliensis TaxID=938288 RepID=A0A9E7DIL8_9FIRM|nr:aminoacyl-tRNA hydrolase [Fenollaria massiliensis]UQK58517.1 aminoacyl-tRNA hydrolase [Fenollaria massiliensis]